ncbi:MAG: apolipoprotein N-acyltransferase [Porticoccaceae bacterium]
MSLTSTKKPTPTKRKIAARTREKPFGNHLLALFCGAILTLSFAPFSIWIIAVASVGVFNLMLMGAGRARSFALAFSFGIGLFGTGASWVYVSIHDYGQAPVVLAAGLTAVFVAGIALVFALPFIFYGMLNNRLPTTRLLVFPALWILGEWFRTWFLTGFPWLLLGYAPLETPLAGWAPVTGVYGLSGAVAATGAAAGLLLTERFSNAAIGGLVILAGVWGGGLYLQQTSWTQATGDTLSVALVQPNHPLLEKWNPDAIPAILDNFAATNASLGDKDIVVWPEAAIPRLRHTVQPFLNQQDKLAAASNTALIVGIPIADYETDYYNGVIGLGMATGEYRKQRLVPFGEYVPLEQLLRGAIAFFDLPMSAFKAGPKNQTPIHIGNGIQIATAICYEIVYPNLVAANARAANILLTVSNDTWFGRSIGPHQHLQMAQMRALENSKPLIRATNDGFTAVINRKGEIDKTISRFESGILEGWVTPRTGETPYVRGGSWWIVVLSFLTIIIVGSRQIKLS